MKNKYSQEKIEKILGSLEGLQPAAAPGFFYTRLLAKMQPAAVQKPFFLFRPAFITVALAVFLILNVFSLLFIETTPKQDITIKGENKPGIESFAKAYDMNTASVYE